MKEAVISESLKESILGFLKSTITLINLKQESDRNKRQTDLSMLKDTISKNQMNHFGVKFWLEDRIKEVL